MSNLYEESVLSVHHWTDTLFSFTATRDPAFRFENGQFAMIGLAVDGKPLLRAYSMVSANYDDTLEFFSIKVPEGPLTSRLQHLKEGDKILVGRKATGTLVLDNLLPEGRHLYLLGTGTGLAPFMSIIRDPETYERFEKVVLMHGCRRSASCSTTPSASAGRVRVSAATELSALNRKCGLICARSARSSAATAACSARRVRRKKSARYKAVVATTAHPKDTPTMVPNGDGPSSRPRATQTAVSTTATAAKARLAATATPATWTAPVRASWSGPRR